MLADELKKKTIGPLELAEKLRQQKEQIEEGIEKSLNTMRIHVKDNAEWLEGKNEFLKNELKMSFKEQE